MKKILILFVMPLFIACSVEQFGSGVDSKVKKVQVKDIIINESYHGEDVTVEGIITSQCGTNGCWFFLHDGSGQVYVNLAPNGLVLPPRNGKRAKVTGSVSVGENGVAVIARGIEVG